MKTFQPSKRSATRFHRDVPGPGLSWNRGLDVLDPCKQLEIPSEDIDNTGICLFDEADGTGHDLSPSGKASSMARRAEKDDTAGRAKNIVEVWLRTLSRREQGLPRVLAQPLEPRWFRISSQTGPPK